MLGWVGRAYHVIDHKTVEDTSNKNENENENENGNNIEKDNGDQQYVCKPNIIVQRNST